MSFSLHSVALCCVEMLKEIWQTRWWAEHTRLPDEDDYHDYRQITNTVTCTSIFYAYDPRIVVGVLKVLNDGTVTLLTVDMTGQITEHVDLLDGLNQLLKAVFVFRWSFNDLKAGDAPLAVSWFYAHLHHQYKLVDSTQLTEQEQQSAIRHIPVFNHAVVDAHQFGWIPRLKAIGRPAKERKVGVLSDLTQHSPFYCRCKQCMPDADFPHMINHRTNKMEPLPLKCHVCVNGTVVINTERGLFAIENYRKDLREARISDMPRKGVRNNLVSQNKLFKEMRVTLEWDPHYLKWLHAQPSKRIRRDTKCDSPVSP